MKKTNMHFGLIALLLIIVIAILFNKPELEISELVPEPTMGLYLEEFRDLEREEIIKSGLQASDAISTRYGVEGLENSKVVFEILEYNEEVYDHFLSLHLSTETIKIGEEDILVPCEVKKLKGTEVKVCAYNEGDVNVYKYTFPVYDNLIVRVLCAEGNELYANKRCEDLTLDLLGRA